MNEAKDIFIYQIGDIKKKKTRDITLHSYSLTPGFNFSQLFFIALGFQSIGNNFVEQQIVIKQKNDLCEDHFTFINNNVYELDEEFDVNDFIDGNRPNVTRTRYIKNIPYILSENGNYTVHHLQNSNQLLDKLFDRNPNLFESLLEYQKTITFNQEIGYVCADYTGEDFILKTLHNINHVSHRPIIFYSKKGIQISDEFYNKFPLKATINKKYDLPPELIQKLPTFYFQLSFAIGSKEGIPSLLLFNDAGVIKISDGSTTQLNEYENIIKCLDTIYMIYYSIDDEFYTNQILLSGLPTKIRTKINEESDSMLKDYIQFKYNDNNWQVQQFNFIDLIKESIMHPAFFGFCSQFELEACFIGSIALTMPSDSAKNFFKDIPNQTTKDQSSSLHKFYSSFTVLALKLLEFLKKLGDGQNAVESDIDSLCNSMFASLPPINDILFDLFIDFIQKIINNNKVSPELQKTFKYYLYLTVDNFDVLGFEKTNFDIKQFKEIFKINDDSCYTTVGAILEDYRELKVPDELLTFQLKLKDYHEPKYRMKKLFKDHLSSSIPEMKIRL